MGIAEQTYYYWRREYGGMYVTPAKNLKDTGKEYTRLKKLVADLSLDNAILKEMLGINIKADVSIGTLKQALSSIG